MEKGKGRADPPKRRGRPPKIGEHIFFKFFLVFDLSPVVAPIIFKDPVVFDKKRFSKRFLYHVLYLKCF